MDIVNVDTNCNFELVLDMVMSYLPTKDCVRTSILSNGWRYKWTTVPILVFDGTCHSSSCKYNKADQSKALASIINHVLSLHNGSIEVFQVRGLCAVPDIDRWILRVSKGSIKTLVLELFWGTVPYQLPSLLFTCGSLSNLKLTNCLLMSPPSSFKGFKSLECLELEFVTLTNDAFVKLISSCPLLKKLTLSVRKQRHTVQYQLPSLLYTCRSLSSLRLVDCLLMLPPSSFNGFKNLKCLELESVTLTNDALERLISSCPLLRKLDLYELEEADNLKINAPNLQHIHIFGDFVSITFGCAMTELSVVCITSPVCGYASLLEFFIKLPNIQQLELSDCHMWFISGDSIVESFHFQCKDLFHLAISMEVSFHGRYPTLYPYRGSSNLTRQHIEAWYGSYLAIELGVWEDNSNCHHEFKQLQRVQMDNFRGTMAELEFLEFVLGSSPVLEEMKVDPRNPRSTHVKWKDVRSIYEFKRASRAKIIFDERVTQIC